MTPAFKGGQGRAPRDIQRDGEFLAMLACAAIAGVLAMLARYLLGGGS